MDMNKIMQNKHVMDMVKGTVSESTRIIIDQQKAIIDNQNDHTRALVSIYQVLELICKFDNLKMPTPLVDMIIDKDKKVV